MPVQAVRHVSPQYEYATVQFMPQIQHPEHATNVHAANACNTVAGAHADSGGYGLATTRQLWQPPDRRPPQIKHGLDIWDT